MTWQPVAGEARKVREMRPSPWWILATLVIGAVLAIRASAFGAPGENATLASQTGQGTEALMVLLERKERALQRREDTLTAREADLRAAEEQITTRLEQVEELRAEVSALLQQLDDEQEIRVAGLVKMFESMRPAQAAAILAEVEEEVALEVLMRMNRAKAGKALAVMPATVAAQFADVLGSPPLP